MKFFLFVLVAEKPDFEEGIILRGGATIEHVVCICYFFAPFRRTREQITDTITLK